jgi:hypothetical protein
MENTYALDYKRGDKILSAKMQNKKIPLLEGKTASAAEII